MTDKAKELQAKLLAAREKAAARAAANPPGPHYEIRLTANRSDDEPWRLTRVGETFGMMVARWAAFRQVALEDARDELAAHFFEWRDHKGQMMIYQRKAMSRTMATMIQQVWSAQAEETIFYFQGERGSLGCQRLDRPILR